MGVKLWSPEHLSYRVQSIYSSIHPYVFMHTYNTIIYVMIFVLMKWTKANAEVEWKIRPNLEQNSWSSNDWRFSNKTLSCTIIKANVNFQFFDLTFFSTTITAISSSAGTVTFYTSYHIDFVFICFSSIFMKIYELNSLSKFFTVVKKLNELSLHASLFAIFLFTQCSILNLPLQR